MFLYYIGIISTVLLILFGISYSLLGYNNVLRDRFIEYITDQPGTEKMKKEEDLLGERVMVPREDRRAVRTNFYRCEEEGTAPVLFYVHGGDFLSGDADLDDDFCRWMADTWKVNVISINYSKIKAHVTTYPQEEILDAVMWYRSHAEEFGIDRKHFVFLAKEAGAYLSLLAAVMLVRRGMIPSGMIFVDPFLDYVAVSMATAGMHPGPISLILSEMTPKAEEYDDELNRAGIYVKTKISADPDVPFEKNADLLKWTEERVNDYLWR